MEVTLQIFFLLTFGEGFGSDMPKAFFNFSEVDRRGAFSRSAGVTKGKLPGLFVKVTK